MDSRQWFGFNTGRRQDLGKRRGCGGTEAQDRAGKWRSWDEWSAVCKQLQSRNPAELTFLRFVER